MFVGGSPDSETEFTKFEQCPCDPGLSDVKDAPMIYSYIAGLGGRSITPDDIRELIRESMDKECPESESVWKGLKQ